MGAGAGFFWQAGLVAGLQVGQALKCSKQKFGFIKQVDKGEITTVKDLES